MHAYAGHALRPVYVTVEWMAHAAMTMPRAERLTAARRIALHLQSRPILYLGAGTCGLASGMDQLIPVVRDLLAQHGHDVTIKEVGCFGLCHREPMLDVKKPGRPRVCFDNVDMKKALTIVEQYILQRCIAGRDGRWASFLRRMRRRTARRWRCPTCIPCRC